jgi:hypothetical protein
VCERWGLGWRLCWLSAASMEWLELFDGGLVLGFEFLPVGLRAIVSPLLLAKRRGLLFDWQ